MMAGEDKRQKNALMMMYYIEEMSPTEIAERTDLEDIGIKDGCSRQNVRHFLFKKHGLKRYDRAWSLQDEHDLAQRMHDITTGQSFKADCTNIALLLERRLSDIMRRVKHMWEQKFGRIENVEELDIILNSKADKEIETMEVPSIMSYEKVQVRVSPVLDSITGELKYPELNLPKYATDGSAAMDICSAISVSISPRSIMTVGTGMVVSIPKGYAGLIMPRSGLAAKHGITVLNAPGLIDSDYCGPQDEVKVILINHSHGSSAGIFNINPGDRIAQLMIVPVANVEVVESDDYDNENSRGGLGSTGIK